MIRIYAEQLAAQLREGLRACYVLCGNDPLLLQESQDAVRQAANAAEFNEHFSFILDAHTEWDAIFSSCQALSLFASRQTLTLMLPENGPSAPMAEQLTLLVSLLHDDILLILRANKLTKGQENSAWFKALSDRCVFVTCQTPEQAQLPRWVAKRAKALSLELDDPANQLLCYCYEGNLLALSQSLERLALLYPDAKLTLPRVEQAVFDAAHFTPYHWIDALLAGKSKRAWHILRQLQQEDSEPVILLRTVQRELLMLLNLRRKMDQMPLRNLFDHYKVWQNRRTLVTQALQRLSVQQLNQAVQLLTQMEIRLKQDYGQSVWPELESLSMLLCGKALPVSFIDAGTGQ
ncbi:DNA polymerase III subunit delta [Rahnella sp. SAP-1]|uniref:DNA polymerase III subunit delta n=1 Tax=Rouxiella aceris TaxID=2703884 RepID=A0A848MIZ0_9GAMM|nr:DNA polymerase III subunit delta [Rouxiella aceris]NMP26274.1 DNA polymerase III subunit delta [Rouxiella aceris]